MRSTKSWYSASTLVAPVSGRERALDTPAPTGIPCQGKVPADSAAGGTRPCCSQRSTWPIPHKRAWLKWNALHKWHQRPRRSCSKSPTGCTPSPSPTITEVLRRLLSGYLVDNASGLDYGVEYRAVPKDADSSLAVEGITGSFEDVRRIYPAKHWHLEERTVSPFKPASRGRGTNVPRQHI